MIDPGFVAVVMTFVMPVALVRVVSRSRERRREMDLEMARLAAGRSAAAGTVPSGALEEERKKREILERRLKALEGVSDEKRLLEARVQNLETIVCSVDYELNQRLNRLAAEASRAGLLAAPAAPAATARAALPAAPAALGGVPAAAPTAPTVALAAGLAPAQVAGELRPGQVVASRYTIEREIGRGGMGAVFLARDAQLGERVALKVISSNLAGDPAGAAERFRREVAAARKITHPNVIRIHDLGQDGALLFLSMEYVEGQTLASFLGRVGRLPVPDAIDILRQVSDGVAAAHAASVIHRDLKPQNILLTSDGGLRRAKVIDFGLAAAAFFVGAGMTATGMILGTPEYMAPEQVRGRPCDPRTDVYALGGVGYHMLAGRPPFTGDTPIAVGFAHVTAPPRPLGELRPDAPAAAEQAIMRALEKEPARRYADAAAFRAAL